MNEKVNNCFLAGDKFMLETHLRQTGFTYRDSGPSTKNQERVKRIEKNRETEDSQDVYQKKLDKVCFQHDIT